MYTKGFEAFWLLKIHFDIVNNIQKISTLTIFDKCLNYKYINNIL